MKSTPLNFRISEDLKKLIDSKAEKENSSSSQIVREILENYFLKAEEYHDDKISSELDEVSDFQHIEEDLSEETENIIYTSRFIQLICWIYDQKSTNPKIHKEKQYESFKKTIIELNNCNQISSELIEEFNKILAELIQKKGRLSYQFKFVKPFGSERFSYDLLNDFIFSKKFPQLWT